MTTAIVAADEFANGSSGNATIGNEALRRLERGPFLIVQAKQNSPPGSPADGDAYLVGATGSGAWTGKAQNTVAVWDGVGAQWLYRALQVGEVYTNLATKVVGVLGTGGATDIETIFTYT